MNLHADAERVARHLCALSQCGCPGSEQFPVANILSFLGMEDSDLAMALDELEERGLLMLLRGQGNQSQLVQAEWELFLLMDEPVKGWNFNEDALAIAKTVARSKSGSVKSADLASSLGWTHRRLNPPTHYLIERDALDARKPMTTRDYYYPNLSKTVGTDRFIRDNPWPTQEKREPPLSDEIDDEQ